MAAFVAWWFVFEVPLPAHPGIALGTSAVVEGHFSTPTRIRTLIHSLEESCVSRYTIGAKDSILVMAGVAPASEFRKLGASLPTRTCLTLVSVPTTPASPPVAQEGVEPSLQRSERCVLPLHYRAMIHSNPVAITTYCSILSKQCGSAKRNFCFSCNLEEDRP